MIRFRPAGRGSAGRNRGARSGFSVGALPKSVGGTIGYRIPIEGAGRPVPGCERRAGKFSESPCSVLRKAAGSVEGKDRPIGFGWAGPPPGEWRGNGALVFPEGRVGKGISGILRLSFGKGRPKGGRIGKRFPIGAVPLESGPSGRCTAVKSPPGGVALPPGGGPGAAPLGPRSPRGPATHGGPVGPAPGRGSPGPGFSRRSVRASPAGATCRSRRRVSGRSAPGRSGSRWSPRCPREPPAR